MNNSMTQAQSDRSTRLRVLIVQLQPGYAGTERHAHELAAGLASAHDVALVLSNRPTEPCRPPGSFVLRTGVAPGIRLFLANRVMPWLGVMLAILRFRPDVIHAHHERSVRIACRCARLVGLPVIGTLHMRYTETNVADCTALVALTEAERSRAARVFPREVAVIETWVMPWPRPNAARMAEIRQQLGLGHAYLFGCVGRLEPVERMDLLIDAFATADLPQARLVIIGDGSARPALEEQIARLQLQGRVVLAPSRQDIRDCYAMFGRFVSAAAFAPFGLTLLEAAEQMVPIIATRTEGALAIARHAPITLVPTDAVDALAAAMRAAITGPAHAPPLKSFAFADRLPQFEALYRRCLPARTS